MIDAGNDFMRDLTNSSVLDLACGKLLTVNCNVFAKDSRAFTTPTDLDVDILHQCTWIPVACCYEELQNLIDLR
jgi:uncharacterized cysteine cluster protein YcgN (CxxCxxCC family)